MMIPRDRAGPCPAPPYLPRGGITSNKGGYDGFITEFLLNTGSAPTVGFSSYFGAGGTDVITAVSAGRQGNPTVVGYTNSTKFPVTTGVVQPKNAGGTDAFATKINAN